MRQYSKSPDMLADKKKFTLRKNIVSQAYDINVSRVRPLEQDMALANNNNNNP
jgi:hypothetical protein